MQPNGAPTESLLSTISRISVEQREEIVKYFIDRFNIHSQICLTVEDDKLIRKSQGAGQELDLFIKIFSNPQAIIDSIKNDEAMRKAESEVQGLNHG